MITIKTENAAFDPDPAPELARILRDLASRVEEMPLPERGTFWHLRDINGNTVGKCAGH